VAAEPLPGRTLHLAFKAATPSLALAVAGVRDEQPVGTNVEVFLQLVVDRRVAQHSVITVAGGQSAELPLQAPLHVGAGRHAIGVTVAAHYTSAATGDITVSPVSLAVSALPPA
ncbi:MAG TPA: hypothetical protein VGH56_11480, partial [Solirubrobacteraceae bacterium]